MELLSVTMFPSSNIIWVSKTKKYETGGACSTNGSETKLNFDVRARREQNTTDSLFTLTLIVLMWRIW